eukprot:GFKZ01000224.1.p1 GENE.GFKZ01000224.1~~GFKZ01000224.1.p1  ORF type:complete len:559 (+),score=56.13 GFKZ01000224.1:44-1678(+)
MPPEATAQISGPSTEESTPQVGNVPTPATPGVWAVSHRDIDRAHAERSHASGPRSYFELVTEVTFIWNYPAKSAFVTGTFSNWETTVPMTLTHGPEGAVWVLSKALPPGDYQYKFIIDNVWRHAPDQPIAFDERGIINNVLSVTVESCGDVTCFCSSFFGNDPSDPLDWEKPDVQIERGIMTPATLKRFQRNVGVAYRYVERDQTHSVPFRKAYMHTEISDRPFDVTVVNVNQLPATRNILDVHTSDGTISRASSFENIDENLRYDPTVPVVEDAAYAATLNDRAGSLPHTAPNRASALSSDPTELAYSVRARLSSPVLGFNPHECHEGIRLTDTNHCAVRVQERGLYKTVRGVLPLREQPTRIYYEFFIFRQATGGGVCIGLSTQELPLNCLCGTRPNSIGFSTSGNLIQTVDGKETWRDFGEELESGCTVGCLVSVKSKPRRGSEKPMRTVTTEFYADGKLKGAVDYEFVGDLDVFPTLSLFAKHARVYSLFSGQDMLFSSCLPPNEEILTLDGRKIRKDASNTPKSLGLSTRHGGGELPRS